MFSLFLSGAIKFMETIRKLSREELAFGRTHKGEMHCMRWCLVYL